ncbi:MAG: hypothetical protein LUH56_06130 [Oscillospiraceae bacterium]|nr:hypothetical protein [Oscillospiraceae bacterium]
MYTTNKMTFPKHETVYDIELIKAEEGKPAIFILSDEGIFIYTLTKGIDIFHCNEFLRGFGFGDEVHFEDYGQYAMLIYRINELLEMKNN